MKKWYFRKFTYENWAHIFAYGMAREMDVFFWERGKYSGIDYNVKLSVDGTILQVVFSGGSSEIVSAFENFIFGYEMLGGDFDSAAKSVGLRLEREVNIGLEELGDAVQEINHGKWEEGSSFKWSVTRQDDDDEMTAPGVSFGEKECAITERLAMIIYECPDKLRALGVIVVDLLSRAIVQGLSVRHKVIVLENVVWGEDRPEIGVVLEFSTSESANLLDNATKLKIELSKDDFVEKMAKKIQENSKEIDVLFDEHSLARFSGIVMGSREWAKIGTEKNVRMLLKTIVMTVDSVGRN